MRNHPLILAYFPILGRFSKSKKTARLKREWLFFLKFSIKMPEFNRFPPKAYALGLRILACLTASSVGANVRYSLTCIPSLAFAPYTRSSPVCAYFHNYIPIFISAIIAEFFQILHYTFESTLLHSCSFFTQLCEFISVSNIHFDRKVFPLIRSQHR